ncbi:MAG: CTP-dependent riboflavin kinase [Caldisericia bacterium]|jgi:riboflavin kinase|nr:CTP-dependent riboflavin kinase [Caldisericia bacterium]
MKLIGTVISGFKEGSKYVKIYKDKIKKAIGINPYEGTLNLKVEIDIKNVKFKNKIKIDGFNGFGTIYLIPCKVNEFYGYIVIPEKSKHKNVVEIISDVSLREKGKLKDGDKITVEFEGFE